MNKLIFVDIDGTLTPAGTNVPPDSALLAIRKAQQAGNRVLLCTGRNVDMLKPLLKYGFDGIIGSSGGYVAVRIPEEEKDREAAGTYVETLSDVEGYYRVLYDHPISREQQEIAVTTLHNNGVFCTIEGKTGSFGDENLKDFLDGTEGGNSEIERWRKALAGNLGIKPMSQYDGQPIYKVVMMARDLSQFDECRALLEKDFQFVLQDVPAHGCVNGELVNRAFDKGKGCVRAAEYYHVPMSDTYGFGDSMNDLEMILAVGTSVCMENGSPALKEKCKLICPAVTDDGLYKAFDQLGLFA